MCGSQTKDGNLRFVFRTLFEEVEWMMTEEKKTEESRSKFKKSVSYQENKRDQVIDDIKELEKKVSLLFCHSFCTWMSTFYRSSFRFETRENGSLDSFRGTSRKKSPFAGDSSFWASGLGSPLWFLFCTDTHLPVILSQEKEAGMCLCWFSSYNFSLCVASFKTLF